MSPTRDDWRPRFLAALTAGASIARAARFAGIGRRTAYDRRESDSAFATMWDEAREAGVLAMIVERTSRDNGAPDQLAARLRAVRYALKRRGLDQALLNELWEIERLLDRQGRDRHREWLEQRERER